MIQKDSKQKFFDWYLCDMLNPAFGVVLLDVKESPLRRIVQVSSRLSNGRIGQISVEAFDCPFDGIQSTLTGLICMMAPTESRGSFHNNRSRLSSILRKSRRCGVCDCPCCFFHCSLDMRSSSARCHCLQCTYFIPDLYRQERSVRS